MTIHKIPKKTCDVIRNVLLPLIVVLPMAIIAVLTADNVLNTVEKLFPPKLQHVVTQFCLQPIFAQTTLESHSQKTTESVVEGLSQFLLNKSTTEWYEPITGIEFVWIEEGCFERERSKSEKDDKGSGILSQKVCLKGFWMGKYEVTNAQFRIWKPEHVSKPEPDSKEHTQYALNEDEQPAVYITWKDAKEFTRWLTKQYENEYEFRLPTRKEWEYACRAGTGKSKFWGDEPENLCLYANMRGCNRPYAGTTSVGTFQPNQFGLYDMMGNVSEWDETILFPADPELAQMYGLAFGTGGSPWHWYIGQNVKCGFGGNFLSGTKNDFVGFRVVRTNSPVRNWH